MFPPALIMIVGAMLIPVAPVRLRPALLILTPLLTLLMIWNLGDGLLLTAPFLNYEIALVETSDVRRLFATIFALMAMVSGLYMFRHARVVEMSASLAYAAGAVGVSFAGDLLSLYLFWEFMVLFSIIVVWSGGTEQARGAGIRYAIMLLIGGIILKIGIEGVYAQTGSHDIQALALDSVATWMLLVGVLIHAAAPPVSAWLADANPSASPTGSVILSAFTTKTAVLALIMLFPGQQVLVWIGMYMIVYGIIYALLENDIRRMLAYAIVNQVGFMVVGVGIGTELAINGVVAFAFAHIIFQALLLMSAGVVVIQTGKRNLRDLGGLYRSMPVTAICGTIGALAMSAFPLTSGFVSGVMITESAASGEPAWPRYGLLAGMAGVFLFVGLKFAWLVFFGKDEGLQAKDPAWNMQAAMIIFAAACVLLGISPGLWYQFLPYEVPYASYTVSHLLTQLVMLLLAGAVFFVCMSWLRRLSIRVIDTDFIYRRAGVQMWRSFVRLLVILSGVLHTRVLDPGKRLPQLWIRYHGPEGPLARTWPTGSMLLWVAVMLVVILIGARLL
ncbi:MAG: Na(+)/H(+) antiporter subunit D [Gammaproteobacteria bacterium]|nr:Na(+)/H(+) antiporter subunit D [Gammaproteobacteria bacterium]